MKIRLLALLLCLTATHMRADAAVGVGGNVTGTVRIADLEVPLDEILVTPKATYVHLIWDSFAERNSIKQAGKTFVWRTAALDLAKKVVLPADPTTKEIRVDMVEFPERDDYGAPRWDKVQFLGRFVVSWVKGKWVVKNRVA